MKKRFTSGWYLLAFGGGGGEAGRCGAESPFSRAISAMARVVARS